MHLQSVYACNFFFFFFLSTILITTNSSTSFRSIRRRNKVAGYRNKEGNDKVRAASSRWLTVSSDPSSKIRNYEFGAKAASWDLSQGRPLSSFPTLPFRHLRCALCDATPPPRAFSISGPKVRSPTSKIRSRESFVILSPISFFLLRFSPFFFFFLELLIVYIRCSFDIGEIENRGKGISGGKKEKRNIEGSLTHHLYG